MQKRIKEAEDIVQKMQKAPKCYFSTLKPSQLEKGLAVVYAITNQETEKVLYVGRTKNLRQRLYTNHLMGTKTSARLKKYLVEDPELPEITDMKAAKEYLKEYCYFQYIPIADMVKRGQIEGLLSFLLNVKYIHEEH